MIVLNIVFLFLFFPVSKFQVIMNKGTESIAIEWKSLFLVNTSRFDPGIVFSGMPDTLAWDQIYCVILGMLGD